MGELRVRKIQEFIKQEVSRIILQELKDPQIGRASCRERV